MSCESKKRNTFVTIDCFCLTVVTVFVLKAEKGEYADIDTEFDGQVYSVKIPGIGSSDGSRKLSLSNLNNNIQTGPFMQTWH